jgi:hypothetical protein
MDRTAPSGARATYLPANRRDAERWRQRVLMTLGLPSVTPRPKVAPVAPGHCSKKIIESWQSCLDVTSEHIVLYIPEPG